MKNKLTVLFVALCTLFSLVGNAQEVVRLKNGSAIKGKVIEQDFEKGTIKIETADGSVFVYNTSDLEKIEKAPQQQPTVYSSQNSYASVNTDDGPYFRRGYRGFAGFSIGHGVGDFDDVIHISTYTIHGVQILPKLFVGAGLSFNGYAIEDDYDDDDYDDYFSVGIFSNVRADFVPKKISPYVDVRLGGLAGDVKGFYFVPTVGIRLNHFNLGLSYELHNNEEEYDYYYDSYTETESIGILSFKCTWDWGARR